MDMKKYIEAGLAVRRNIRRFLLENDIDFIEEKGWVDSVFYLKCSDEKYIWVVKVLDNFTRRLESNTN